MKLIAKHDEPDIESSLSGESFSPSAFFSFKDQPRRPRSRIDVLEEAAAGRRVLHVGFVDHLPLLDLKRSSGSWLHDRLIRRAESCGGIDINENGVERLKGEGYENLFTGDVSRPTSEVTQGAWDVLILGEMLEHLDDPVRFLSDIRGNWPDDVEVVVSVPNAWDWPTLRAVLRDGEFINTDHRFWFTPYTLSKVAYRAGFRTVDLELCETSPPQNQNFLRRIKRRMIEMTILRKPLLRSTIVARLTPIQ